MATAEVLAIAFTGIAPTMDFAEHSPIAVKDEGRAARYRGDPVTANPYPDGSAEHDLWKRAWQQPDEGEKRDDVRTAV